MAVKINEDEFSDVDLETLNSGDYYYVGFLDENVEIQAEPISGYFSLLSAIFGEKNLITYKGVIDNYEQYVLEPINSALDTIEEKETLYLKKYHGMEDGNRLTLQEIGEAYNKTGQRIQQVVAKATRKLRHPSRARSLKYVFFDERYDDEISISYSKYLEPLITEEISSYYSNKVSEINKLLSCNIIHSPRFIQKESAANTGKINSQDDIERLEFSVRTFNCLKRAGINTISELKKLSDDDLIQIRNFGRKNMDEVKDKLEHIGQTTRTSDIKINQLGLSEDNYYFLKNAGFETLYDLMKIQLLNLLSLNNKDVNVDLNEIAIKLKEAISNIDYNNKIEKYLLDTNTMFTIKGEIPLTRTNLPVEDIVNLIKNGFFYVSDYLEYYDLIQMPNSNFSFLNKESKHLILKYSQPVMRVKFSPELQELLKREDIKSFADMKKNQYKLSNKLKKEINEIDGLITIRKQQFKDE